MLSIELLSAMDSFYCLRSGTMWLRDQELWEQDWSRGLNAWLEALIKKQTKMHCHQSWFGTMVKFPRLLQFQLWVGSAIEQRYRGMSSSIDEVIVWI